MERYHTNREQNNSITAKKIKFRDKNSSLDKREGSVSQNAVSLLEQVRQKIVLVRGCQVILDSDVAALYGVETREIN